jgi:hypothetical protein
MSVDDAIGMSAKAPCSVPGYGGGNGFSARPAAIAANAATVGDPQERVERGVSFGITGEQAFRNVPIGMPQPGFHLAGAPHQCLESPVGVNRRVNHCEGPTRQLTGLDQWPAPNPLHPAVDVGMRKEIAHGVGMAYRSPAEEGVEQPDLVVSEHVAGSTLLHQRPDDLQGLKVRRAPVDQVPHQPEFEVLAVNATDSLEKLRKLRSAPLDVSDEHRLHGRE